MTPLGFRGKVADLGVKSPKFPFAVTLNYRRYHIPSRECLGVIVHSGHLDHLDACVSHLDFTTAKVPFLHSSQESPRHPPQQRARKPPWTSNHPELQGAAASEWP